MPVGGRCEPQANEAWPLDDDRPVNGVLMWTRAVDGSTVGASDGEP
jgi:hypothetical protein